MSKITIIRADGKVGIDGQFFSVDLADLDADIHAIQFDQGTGTGHIEYINNAKPNRPIGKTAFRIFEKYITRWKAAQIPPPTPEEVAAEAARVTALETQATADESARSAAKGDTVVQYLVTHTPAEISTYVQTNVTDLASARNLLAKLAVAVSVLARRDLR